MTALPTLPSTINVLETRDFIGVEESLTPRERYERWRRYADERQRQKGPPEEPPLTMEEIVAIVKETRAEIYAEQQKNSTRG